MTRIPSAATVAVLLSLLVASTALAQDDARTLFQRGQVAYTQGDYDAAIQSWTQAYSMDPRPLLQWNLAQAYERLGRLDEAAAALDLYLQHADPSDEHQADARARLGAIRTRIEATGILLTGGPDGAAVTMDGNDAGRLPRPDAFHVSAGTHRIVVHAQGYADFTSTVVVPAGQQTTIEVEMAPTSSTTVASSGSEPPIVPIIVWSIAGVTLVTGAVLGGVALATASSAPASTGPEADTARGLALGSDITFGISAAAAVTALVLTLVMPSGSSSESATATAFRLTPNGFALTF
ncbi:MAG: tetratricopeptide repeat protein [Sandaracinus sp.]